MLMSTIILNAQEQIVDQIIAIIGNQMVRSSELQLRRNQLQQQGVDASGMDDCMLFENLLQERILLNQALLDSIAVGEGEINGELDRRVRYFTQMLGSREKLEEQYGKSIIELKEEFREQIKEQLLISRAQGNITSGVNVTPEEVKKYFRKIPSDSVPRFNTQYEIGQIAIVPEASKKQDSLALAKATQIRDRIIKGEDFATLALLYSDDPGSATNGGDLGFQERGTFVPEFEEAAFRLEKDELSSIVKTEYGYHLLKGIERRGEQVHVMHILVAPKVTSIELSKAKIRLDTVLKQVKAGKMTFEQAVRLYSNDEETVPSGGMLMNPETASTTFEASQVDPKIYFQIEKLEEGGFSDISFFSTLRGKQGVRIMYLKSIVPQHRASLTTDYDKIKALCLASKKQEKMQEWYSSKMKKNYLKVNEAYKNCSSLLH